MSTDRIDDVELGSSVGDDNESSISINININSGSDVEDVEASFALNESEESCIDKNGILLEESNRVDGDQVHEDQGHLTLKPDNAEATSIALLKTMHQFGAATSPERTDESPNFYKYRDFSNANEKDIQNAIDATPTAPKNSRAQTSGIEKLPPKLYAILTQKDFQDIITWMPHGRSWKVLKPRLFESLVMPIFFQYGNYHSFNRLVNAWSFRRVATGVDRGSYYHELFLRGKPKLQKFMRRLPKSHKKPPMRAEDEPNFYALDKEKPLPQCDDNPGSNQFTNLYPTPFGMVSGGAPMLIPVQMPAPVQWQPRYHAISGATGWGFAGINDVHDTEVPFVCGIDGMVSQNMHSLGIPMVSASALSLTGQSPGGINSVMGSGGLCGNEMGDGIETGMNMSTGGEMGIESTETGQGAFDIEEPITKDGPMGL